MEMPLTCFAIAVMAIVIALLMLLRYLTDRAA
jgi:hypothetical protein